MTRLIVVSNRVASVTEGKSSAGGLVVGVLDALRETGGIWLGWSGTLESKLMLTSSSERHENIEFLTVPLTKRDYDRYYRGFSNGVLWPTFHYRIDLSRYTRIDYMGYLEVNRKFSQILASTVKQSDRIWVHDYHLIPLGKACRDLGIQNKIGFFLHIPFPSPAVLKTIPPHRELVESMCAYDLLGFQTENDVQAFLDYAARCLGANVTDNVVKLNGRITKVGAYPIGIHPEQVKALSKESIHSKPLATLKAGLLDRKLIVSVDRLDYSKGLVERFNAFEQLLETSPHYRGKVTFVQIAPPSRQDVQGYRQIRRQLESTAGRINGKWTELSWTPIRYMNRSYDRGLLMAIFRASQVGLVTPLRDGMNLVAKEYIASQPAHDPGVLVLSEFAGAAAEMRNGAVMVNPYDLQGMADGLNRALSMGLEERKSRYEHLMAVLTENNLSIWRDRFLSDLAAEDLKRPASIPTPIAAKRPV